MGRLRYISIIAVVFSSLGAILMFIIGAAKTTRAFRGYFFNQTLFHNAPPTLDISGQAMIQVIEGMDTFLLALVLLIFSGGIFNLFVSRIDKAADDSNGLTSKIYSINSIERLKKVLMEVILVMLSVLFLRGVLFLGEDIPWRALVLPVGIVLIALSLRLVEWRNH